MVPPFLRLPPTDRVTSSRTGWTRAHWEAVADRMLDGVAPYATPGGAQYRLPGRGSWSGVVLDGLEGYARTFLLAAFRIAGAGGTGEEAERLAERYARGLAAGTDPASPEAWPALTDCSQQMVEAASIAVALHETRPWIWDRLEQPVRERVAGWLSGFVGGRTWDNNWRLFQVVSEQFLASVGAPFRQADIDAGLDRLEDWYVGDGWYTDGDGRNFDYYGGWALHLYPLLWARIAGPAGEERAAVYRRRLAAFLADYPHFFGADGAPVHQGRSLAYRFAALAPVWLGALAGCSPLAPGLTRRLASGTLRHFVERGVPDERGLLPLGWYGTHLPATQPYSGPASPYWASKGFLGLLLPPDHPVWTAREEPLPVESGDTAVALRAPNWLLHGTRHDGIVRLVNHGSDHNPPSGPGQDDPHYAKFGYSTATAPESAEPAWRRTVDGHFALLGPDGTPSRRLRVEPLGTCTPTSAASRYEVPAAGDGRPATVETTSVLHGPWEIRVHRVDGPHLGVREGGYAVAGAEPPHAEHGPGRSLCRTETGLTSVVAALYGWQPAPEGTSAPGRGPGAAEGAGGSEPAPEVRAATGSAVAREVHANAFGPHSATPYLTAPPSTAPSSCYVTLVVLTRDTCDPVALRSAVSCDPVDATATPAARSTVRLRFPDSHTVEV
ncbi:DUF2264 domain-containing protein [Actinacidiphila yeochonensis]|uniref:DUF2264 domain-containing protein n=1 Tax=Actinacidiphila yeochonensis TaxID=89050 RepID=UPI00056B4001|nr:DUF2264 domain-containing protein [Actinacidiphila yeochonensis]